MICLIPSRAGSKRLPGKGTKMLGSKPLIAWTLEAAVQSGVFECIHVCTDDPAIITLINDQPTETWIPPANVIVRGRVPDNQPDIEWVTSALEQVGNPDEFCIARVTSPFRSAATIRRAFAEWNRVKDGADSMRAVRKVSEHPGKMWIVPPDARFGIAMPPFVSDRRRLPDFPWNSPTQSLPPLFVQSAGLEMAWTESTVAKGSISGDRVAPFVVSGPEALDINDEWDWYVAEALIAKGRVDATPSS